MVRLAAVALRPYAKSARAPTSGVREGCWIEVLDDEGRMGRGDIATWPGFAASLPELMTAMDGLAARAREAEHGSLEAWCDEARRLASPVRFGWETALYDLWGHRRQTSVAHLLASDPQERVKINGLVADADEAVAAWQQGATTLKIKVGPQHSPTWFRSLHAAVPEARLRLDFGGRFTPTAAVAWLERVRDLDLDYVEDPVAERDTEAWAAVAKTGVPLAIDQHAGHATWVEKLLMSGDASVVVLKPMFDGGLRETLALAKRWQALGGRVVVTSALETRVGVVAAMHLAAALRLDDACGLTSPIDGAWGAQAVGEVLVPTGSGLGWSPS